MGPFGAARILTALVAAAYASTASPTLIIAPPVAMLQTGSPTPAASELLRIHDASLRVGPLSDQSIKMKMEPVLLPFALGRIGVAMLLLASPGSLLCGVHTVDRPHRVPPIN